MSEVAVKETQDNVVQLATDYLKLVGQKIPQKDAKQFLELCKSFQLNPFKREIYLIPYGEQANIIVGYEVYLKRAERSGKLSGWRVWTEGKLSDGTLKACIEIRRKDWDQPFYHEVYYTEYKRSTNIWKEKPITMIKKVAIAQGFRLAFPEELAGIPYTEDEIDIQPEETQVVQAEVEPEPEPDPNEIPIELLKNDAQFLQFLREKLPPETQEKIKQMRLTSKTLKQVASSASYRIDAFCKEIDSLMEGK